MTKTIQLLITCLIDTLQPQIGESVVRVLERAGVNVSFPTDQTCCGQPAFNAGLRHEARQMARHTIKTFEAHPGPVVIPSGSCTAMIRHGYPELFRSDAEWLARAQALAERCFEFTEFLVDQLGIDNFDVSYPENISYHPSCHLLRGIGVDEQPRTLLENLHGCEIHELPHADDCCGFGGVFSIEHPEISAEMLKRKIANIGASRASTVVLCDTGCLLHIKGGLHRLGKPTKVLHIAEVLDQASGQPLG